MEEDKVEDTGSRTSISLERSSSGKSINLRHLNDPRCFQELPRVAPPVPFSIDDEVIDGYGIDELIDKKLYVAAAARAQDELIRTDGADHQRIFELWDKRIKCLLRVRMTAAIKEEARLFGDLGSDRYRVDDALSIVPWNFRIMMVNIQTGGEPALSRYYALAREARVEEANASNTSIAKNELRASAETWRDRLRELGLQVGATLMNIGDFPTALDHLESYYETLIKGSEEDKQFSTKAALALGIVHLKTGDTLSARGYFEKAKAKLFVAVCSCADADWSEANTLLEAVGAGANDNNLALVKVNEAKLDEAIGILEKKAKTNPTNLIMSNLFTLYDLTHDVANPAKSALLKSLRDSGVESLGTYEFLKK